MMNYLLPDLFLCCLCGTKI